MTEEEVIAEAERRYHMDPMFHARVNTTLGVLATRDKKPIDPVLQDLIKLAAGVALIVKDIHP